MAALLLLRASEHTALTARTQELRSEQAELAAAVEAQAQQLDTLSGSSSEALALLQACREDCAEQGKALAETTALLLAQQTARGELQEGVDVLTVQHTVLAAQTAGRTTELRSEQALLVADVGALVDSSNEAEDMLQTRRRDCADATARLSAQQAAGDELQQGELQQGVHVLSNRNAELAARIEEVRSEETERVANVGAHAQQLDALLDRSCEKIKYCNELL